MSVLHDTREPEGTRTKDTPPTPEKPGDFVAKGDLLGLLDHIESQRDGWHMYGCMDKVAQCIRRQAIDNPDGLCDALLLRIICLAGVLWLRVDAHIRRRLSQADFPDVMLPGDLVQEGWLERQQRTGRFIAEMAAARTRFRHVCSVTRERDRKLDESETRHVAQPLDEDPGKDGSGQAPPAEGRVPRTTHHFDFP
jgi:hypothetical protein